MIEDHCPACRIAHKPGFFIVREAGVRSCVFCGYEEPFGEPRYPVPAILPRAGAPALPSPWRSARERDGAAPSP